jgi:tight adherence protein B
MAIVIIALMLTATAVALIIMLLLQQTLEQHKKSFDTTTKNNLADMFIFVDPAKLFQYSIAAVVVVPILLWLMFDNPIIPVVAGGFIFVMPKYVVERIRKKRQSTFEKQLPDALLMVSGSMRAGASLSVAMESMVREQKPPLSQEFDLMLREQRLGVDFEVALANMEKRMPLPDFVLLVAAMRITREVGGNFANILESLASTLRRKHEMEGKINALTAQGKAQGIVMAALPLFLMLILTYMEPEAMAPLYHTLYGWATLFVIFFFIIIGYMGIRKIVSIDV